MYKFANILFINKLERLRKNDNIGIITYNDNLLPRGPDESAVLLWRPEWGCCYVRRGVGLFLEMEGDVAVGTEGGLESGGWG